MRYILNLKSEPSPKAWAWRLIFGPAQIVDGILETITLGSFSPSLTYRVARQLAKSRMESKEITG